MFPSCDYTSSLSHCFPVLGSDAISGETSVIRDLEQCNVK